MIKYGQLVCSRKSYFVNSLFWYFLTLFSGFLLYPLAYYLKIKYVSAHTVFNDRSLEFRGSLFTCYRKFITYFLLTIVTLGIFYFFVKGKMIKWEVENTHFAGAGRLNDASYFSYKLSDYFIASVNGIIFTVLTLFIGYPQYLVMKYRIKENNRHIDGKRTEFVGEVKKAYKAFIFTLFLYVVTLGIYKLFKDYEIRKYLTNNTILKDDDKVRLFKTNSVERITDWCINHKVATYIVYGVLTVLLLCLAAYIIYLLVMFIMAKLSY